LFWASRITRVTMLWIKLKQTQSINRFLHRNLIFH